MKQLKMVLAAGALVCAFGNAAFAQGAWPTRPITMIVPYLAGGGADPIARLLADGMSKRLGQPVVVDFKAGAAGTIGAQAVVNAPADGYTILFTPPAPIINAKLLMPSLSYDPDRDLVPIMEISFSPMVIMANGEFGPKTLKELIDYAKANPGKVMAGVPALGGTGHLATAMIETATGVKLTMVPYRGTGGLLPDMLGGRLNISQDLPAAYVPHLKSGKVRVIAVLGTTRIPSLPDVPTSVESGFPKLQIGAWYGLFGPKGLPRDILVKINSAANETLKDPAAKTKVEELGYETVGGTPEKLADDIKRDLVTLGEVVRLGNVKME